MNKIKFILYISILIAILAGCGKRINIGTIEETAVIERDDKIYAVITDDTPETKAAEECLSYLTGLNDKTVDYYKAAEIIKPYENSDNADVLYCLGFMHWNAAGLQYDDLLAKDLLEKAEKKGNYYASIQLGNIYMNGPANVERDYEISRDYYRRAILNGLSEGYYGLGLIYSHGYGVEKNSDEAYRYFEKTINEGKDPFYSALSCFEIGLLYYNGEKRDNSGEEDDPEYEKALEWFNKAEKSDLDAAYYIAQMYGNGQGVEKNTDTMMEYYEKSANAGYCRSMLMLGDIYINGKDVDQDTEKGMQWYEKAAELNDCLAFFRLGQIYDEGRLVEADENKAKEFYDKAYAAGYEN